MKTALALLYLAASKGILPDFKQNTNNVPVCNLDEPNILGVPTKLLLAYSPVDPRYDAKHPFIGIRDEFEVEDE